MKKSLCIFISLFIFTAAANAQKILPFKPSISIALKGGLSMPLSGGTYTSVQTFPFAGGTTAYEGGTFKDYFGAFPGAQLDAAVNITSSFGIFGNFSADFLTPKEARVGIQGGMYTQSNATQLSGSIGPRVYINIPGNIFYKLYTEAGFGIYSLKYGDEKITFSSSQDNFSYSAASQMGFNVGAGLNIKSGATSFINVSIKYHNILKKSNVDIIEKWTHNTGGQNELIISDASYDLAERSYIQISAGLGFNFGF